MLAELNEMFALQLKDRKEREKDSLFSQRQQIYIILFLRVIRQSSYTGTAGIGQYALFSPRPHVVFIPKATDANFAVG